MTLIYKRFLLNELEQKYVATCYPLPDRPGLCECEKWKNDIKNRLREGNKTFEITSLDIAKPFPTLAKLIDEGFFDDSKFVEYFEGIHEESHNMRMYLFVKKMLRGKNLNSMEEGPRQALLNVLEHCYGCSFRVYDKKNNLEYAYFGKLENPRIDLTHFGSEITGNYFALHGKSPNGSIAIRELTKDEFESYKIWFEERAKSKENPFVKYKKNLEKMIFN